MDVFEETVIAKLAFRSRLVVIFLQCIANLVIADHNAGVFNPPDTDTKTVADKIVLFTLGGFRRWDAIYFLHIAQHGYTYENCVAFFPLFPWILSSVKILSHLCPVLSEFSLLLVAGVTLNVALFVAAAVVLMWLGQAVTQDDRLAFYAAVLFCINPASIFMSAPYTETFFACLSFGGMLCVAQEKLFAGSLLFGAAALTRSNGLVSLGFIFHALAVKLIGYVSFAYQIHYSSVMNRLARVIQEVIKVGFRAVFYLIVTIIPFAAFQFYIYKRFCFPENQIEERHSLKTSVISYGRTEEYKLVGDRPVSPWCFDAVPLSYAYIQSHHWGVGFMKYYQVKQIPNFILALPIITLSVCAGYSFYVQNPAACRTLGLLQRGKLKVETVGGCTAKRKGGWCSVQLITYFVHLLFLTMFGCLFMHIQVLTRFLCSGSPMIYWFAAYIIFHEDESSPTTIFEDSIETCSLLNLWTVYTKSTTQAKCILVFFVAYFLIGTIAFSNFLPWT